MLSRRAGACRPAVAEHSSGTAAPTSDGPACWRALAALVFVLGASNADASSLVSLSGRAMGTTWAVKFFQPAVPLEPEAVEREIAVRLEQLEQQFSTYRPQSTVSRFNAAPHTDWFDVALEVARVAVESRRISELTGGAFDVTVLPLIELWGFGSKGGAGSVPSANAITAARELVGWRRLEARLSPPALRKMRPDVTADFSSMAKGLAADSVGELLTRLGAPNHLVQIGGDVKTGGVGREGAGWRTAIEQPLEHERAFAEIVDLAGMALSTSGDARNHFVAGGRRYGHIIDPRTGEPVASELASVSVVHVSCATSSALATALFVLGSEDGYRFAEQHRLACLFLARVGHGLVARATPEFERLRSSR